MKHPWLAYAVVGGLGISAGLLVAGFPDRSSDARPIAATEVDTTATTTSLPLTATTAPPTTTTSPGTTTTTTTTTTTPLPERTDIVVLAANASVVGGTAGRSADLLRSIGYANVATTDGTEILGGTVVYFAVGFETSAFRVVDDLELGPTYVLPLAEAPAVVGGLGNTQILLYIGRQ